MATIPAAGYISNAARTQSEIQQALEDTIASLRQMPGAAEPESYMVIASGTATPPGSAGIFLIDTEGLAATDDCANIATTNYPDGSCIVLRNAQLGRVVTLKHTAGGAGQLNLDRSVDYVLDDEHKWVLLQRRSTDWYEIFRGPARLTSFVVAKSSGFTVAKEHFGNVFACTGTFTAVLTAAASLGNGFICGIRNVSTGQITIDPNSSELLDGAATLVVLPGWSYMLVCDGMAWRTISATGPQPAKNPIINGTMEVWQRGTGFTSVLSGAYTADRWLYSASGAGVININRSTNVPSMAQAGVVFNYSLEVDVATADASIAAGDNYQMSCRMEGGAWRHFAQRQVTVSFWVMSTKTGTHCIALRNAGSDRSYVAEYTISVSNTWEYKQLTVLASPSAGTWNYTTGIGVELFFTLAVGSTFQTTAGAWQTGNFTGTSNQVNVMDSTSNFFRLTGVKLELGTSATPFDVVSFEEEYLRCQRYFQKSMPYATAPATNLGNNTGEFIFTCPVGASSTFNSIQVPLGLPMRGNPTITYYNPNAANNTVRNRNTNTDCTSPSAYNNIEKSFTIQATNPAGGAVSHTMAVHWSAESEL